MGEAQGWMTGQDAGSHTVVLDLDSIRRFGHLHEGKFLDVLSLLLII